MSDLTPTPKVAATGAAGALAVIAVWVCSLFGLDVPDPVSAAFAVLIAASAGYLIPSKA